MRIVQLAVLLVALSGCAMSTPTAPPSSTPTPSASLPSSEPTSPTDPAEVISTLQISGRGVSVVDEVGATIFQHPWDEDGDALVSDLTVLFGSAPATSFVEGFGLHYPARDVYSWDGISVAVSTYQHADSIDSQYHFDPEVRLTAAVHGNVTLETTGGISVGDTAGEHLQELALSYISDEFGDHYYVEPNSANQGQFRAVDAYADGSRAIITMILAPSDAGTGL